MRLFMVLCPWEEAKRAILPLTTRLRVNIHTRFLTTPMRFLFTRRFTTLLPPLTTPIPLHIAQHPSTHKLFLTTLIPPRITRPLTTHVQPRSQDLSTHKPLRFGRTQPPRSQALITHTPSRTIRVPPRSQALTTLTRLPTSLDLIIRSFPGVNTVFMRMARIIQRACIPSPTTVVLSPALTR